MEPVNGVPSPLATWPFGPNCLHFFARHKVYIEGSPLNRPDFTASARPVPDLYPAPPSPPSPAPLTTSSIATASSDTSSWKPSTAFQEGHVDKAAADLRAPKRPRLDHPASSSDAPPTAVAPSGASSSQQPLVRSKVPLLLDPRLRSWLVEAEAAVTRCSGPALDPVRVARNEGPPTSTDAPKVLSSGLEFAIRAFCRSPEDGLLVGWLCRFWLRDEGATLRSKHLVEVLSTRAPGDLDALVSAGGGGGDRHARLLKVLSRAEENGLLHLWSKADGSADIELAKDYCPPGLTFAPLISLLQHQLCDNPHRAKSVSWIIGALQHTHVPTSRLTGADLPEYIRRACHRDVATHVQGPGWGGIMLHVQYWDPSSPFSRPSNAVDAVADPGYRSHLREMPFWREPRIRELGQSQDTDEFLGAKFPNPGPPTGRSARGGASRSPPASSFARSPSPPNGRIASPSHSSHNPAALNEFEPLIRSLRWTHMGPSPTLERFENAISSKARHAVLAKYGSIRRMLDVAASNGIVELWQVGLSNTWRVSLNASLA